MAYSDVKKLTTDNLQTFFDGNLWIITRRRKTNTDSNIRLLDVPKRIIEKYEGLCADDVMTHDNLERFQDTYTEKMQKYGLERGIRGSEARHIDTTQFYKMVYTENQLLKEENKELAQEQQDIHDSVRSLYDMKDEAREKFLNMDNYVKKRKKDVANVEAYLNKLKKGYESYKAQDAKLQLFKESKDSDKLKLSINGQNIINWFKQKYQKLKQSVKPHIKPTPLKQKNGLGI